ncbi:hypothetical protein Mame01_28730 [Microbispora amethystogenes]|nr:hypothetical protein Mame01_28730 [Microbispora amethystogenes]
MLAGQTIAITEFPGHQKEHFTPYGLWGTAQPAVEIRVEMTESKRF